MNNTLTLVVIGIYTAIYAYVFIVQKSEISKLKSIGDNMKVYMDLFNLDTLKKYQDIKDEAAAIAAGNFVSNHEKVKAMVEEIFDNSHHQLKVDFFEMKGKEHSQLYRLSLELLLVMTKEERINFIREKLPDCMHYYENMLDEPQLTENS